MMNTKVSGIILLPHILLIFIYIGLITIWKPLIALWTTELGFTNKRLIGKIGWLNTKVLDTPLNKVNNISIEQGLIGKIFGYGTVVVTSSSGAYNFRYISQPEVFRNHLNEQISKFDEDRIQKQAEMLSKTNRMNTTTAVLQSTTDVTVEIKKYKELLDVGAITEEEFESKKKQLLGL